MVEIGLCKLSNNRIEQLTNHLDNVIKKSN